MRFSPLLPGSRFAHPGYERTKEKIKGSRTPTDAVLNRLPRGKRAPCRARSPVGVPRRLLSKGLTHPEDSASDQASRSAYRWRGYPAGVRPGYSEHLACRSWCRQVDVRNRPSAKATKPCPRAPQLAPASRSHRPASLHEEREAAASTRRARRVKPNHLHGLLFDSIAVFALRLSGGTTWARCDVRIKKILIGRRRRPARLHCAKSRRRRDLCSLAVAKSRVILCR